MKLIHLTTDPELKKELIKIYGESVESLDNATCWDDLVIPEEKYLTSILKEQRIGKGQCPFFKVRENHFNYCLAKAKRLSKNGIYDMGDTLPTIRGAEYNSKVGHIYMQIWCLQDKDQYNACVLFPLNSVNNGV